MFAAIARFRFNRPLTAEDFETNTRVLVPMVKNQAGYRGYVEVKCGERESVSITLWASQSDAECGVAALRPQLTELFGSAMAGPPERSFGEVEYVDLEQQTR